MSSAPRRAFGRTILLPFLLLYGGAIAPLFVCDPLPLNDLPNHLARMHIIAQIEHTPALQRYYAITWQLLPNLSLDVIVPPLARLVGASRAMWLFVALTLLLLASSAIALHAALFRRLTPIPLCAFLLLYNRELLWGFLSFVFAAGLSLWLFAGWIWLRGRPQRLRGPLFALLALLLYFAHLHAFGCYAVMVLGYELTLARSEWRIQPRRAAVSLSSAVLQLIPPALLFLLASPTGELVGQLSYGTLSSKLARLLAPFNNYHPTIDIVTFLLCGGLLGLGLLRGDLRLHPCMRLPVLGLGLLFILLPQQLFDAWSVDRRILLVLSLALISSLELQPIDHRLRWSLALALLGIFILRGAIITRHWHRADAIYARHIRVLDQVPYGSRLAVIVVGPERPHLGDPPLWELGNLAVLRRHAFTNAMFAEQGHHILRVRHKPSATFYRSPSQKFVVPDSATKLPSDPRQQTPLDAFDFVYVVNEQLIGKPRPQWLRPIAARGNAALYRIDHASRRQQDNAAPTAWAR